MLGRGVPRVRDPAVAVALHEARRTAKRRRIAGAVDGEHAVELNEVAAPGLPVWYEAVWRVRGRERARRRSGGPALAPVRRAFDDFVREVRAACAASNSRGGGAGRVARGGAR